MTQELINFLKEVSAFNQWLIDEKVKSKADLKRKFRSSGLTQKRALKLYNFLTDLNNNLTRFTIENVTR